MTENTTFVELKRTGVLQDTKDLASKLVKDLKDDALQIYEDIKFEFVPKKSVTSLLPAIKDFILSYIHIPYFPAFHSPGWFLRYLVGPYNREYVDSFTSDVGAGLTVGLTLIPQALSYAQLANLNPINGLYAAVLPSAVYTFFGTGLQLAVGPVALVSLLVGEIVSHYGATPGSQAAQDVGTQAAFSVGVILIVLSLLNLGSLVHYVAFPVMSGFTTGAAMIIGFSQLRTAFGFTNSPPQTGQPGYDYNYEVMQWYIRHWNDQQYVKNVQYKSITYSPSFKPAREWSPNDVTKLDVKNYISMSFAFGLFIPLLALKLFQTRLKISLSAEFKKTILWKVIDFIINITPFIGLIISASAAYRLKKNYPLFKGPSTNKLAYNKNVILRTFRPTLNPPPGPSVTAGPTTYISTTYKSNYFVNNFSIVGYVTPGLDFLKSPALPYDFWTFLADCIPLTFVAYMEGYGVANRIATLRNELHILHPSQEMWAMGAANILGSVSSAFPVAGSFSRSSLNHSCGARTPLSKVSTMLLIVTALALLTETFFYIPNAALSAIIWVAIWPLVKLDDLWFCYRYSRKDFFLITLTLVLEFVFNTEIGLAVGLGMSLVLYVVSSGMSENTRVRHVVLADNNDGIDVSVLEGSTLTFINAAAVKTALIQLSYLEVTLAEDASLSNTIHHAVGSAMDKVLRPNLLKPVKTLPRAVIVDLTHLRTVDITGLIAYKEFVEETEGRGVNVISINVHDSVVGALEKYKIGNIIYDENDSDINTYLKQSTLPTEVKRRKTLHVAEIYPDAVKDNIESP